MVVGVVDETDADWICCGEMVLVAEEATACVAMGRRRVVVDGCVTGVVVSGEGTGMLSVSITSCFNRMVEGGLCKIQRK